MSNSTSGRQRINSLSFSITVGDTDIVCDKMSLDIDDGTTFAKKNGRPDGWLLGEVSAKGELSIGLDEFKKLKSAAQSAGSWQELAPFDIVAYAKAGDDETKVEAFGCKITLAKLLDVDKGSSDKSVRSVPFVVTAPEFVNIDGIPYIKAQQKG
ncbi:MAG: hypothetical protein RL095_2176 [Verrucomicrobiota bacterium]|jgi:hypothetical protein